MGEIVNLRKLNDDILTERAIQTQIDKKLKMYAGDFNRFEEYCNQQKRSISFDSLEKYLFHTIQSRKKLSTFNRRAAGVKYYLINQYGLLETEQQTHRIAQLRSMYNNQEYSEQKLMHGQSAEDKNEVMHLIDKLDTRAKAIALVNLVTANRPSEMISLRIKHFNLKNKSVSVYMTKQKGWHVKRLTLNCINAIRAYIDKYQLSENDYFVGKVDKHGNLTSVKISDTAYRNTIHRWLGFSPYTLRKTQITAMHEAGADLATIATQSGHSSLETISKHYLEIHNTTIDKYL
ncbi:tyrosine-type recombinase/integrase [Rummeliibacillus pycnus]|uniref:tyrosine-type recombinase/integrase n=1 Tax=Rummeliibacillus pycnus TaxID=101070 RepID=UPI000C9BCA60|nr:site-specific integrase [Rummeliibacillus pycnus]